MDCAVVLIGTWGVERIAERLSLGEQAAIFHTILEGYGMRDAERIRIGDHNIPGSVRRLMVDRHRKPHPSRVVPGHIASKLKIVSHHR